MTKNTQTPAKVTVALAPISLETMGQYVKANAQAFASNATAMTKADRDLLLNTSKAARLIGTPLTEAQWNKQLAPAARKAIEAKGYADVSGALARAKLVALCVNSGVAALQPVAGQTINTFCTHVRALLPDAKLADGAWIMERGEDGVSPKAKAGAKAGKTKTRPDASSDTAKERAAAILMGSEEGAQRLLLALGAYRGEFDRWYATAVAAPEAAKAKGDAPKLQAVK